MQAVHQLAERLIQNVGQVILGKRDVIELTLSALPAYVRQHDLSYGIAWEL